MVEICECGHTRTQHYNNFITGTSCRICECQSYKKGGERLPEFKYEFHVSPHVGLPGVLTIRIYLNGERRGTITLTPNEWNTLSKILLEGNYSQDGEIEIEILVQGSVHAYIEGADNGKQILGGPSSTTD